MKNFIILLLCSGLSIASLAQNIVQGEYFIDTDLGFGKNTLVNFTLASDGTFPLPPISVSGFQPGYHKLYIRTKDSDGKWSLTARRNIEVFASDAKTTVVKGEYFIDTDPGFGVATPITISVPDSMILQNFSAIASSLSEGYHKLYGRFLDNKGKWSLTFRRNIEVYKSDATKVMKAEYFFKTDEGFGNCASVVFANPAADGTFSFNIPKNTIPTDADTLFIRVQNDVENRWSITQIFPNLNIVLPLTLLNFTVTKQNTVAQLDWQTANEVNTAYFNVQRSTDGINFTSIGKVAAKAGSGLQNNYSYNDNIANLKAGKIFYRLQMTDNDGSYSYSKISYITINGNNLQIAIHPNPAHNYFIINNYRDIDIKTANILVTDMTGRTLIRQKFNNSTEQRINITSLSKGMYMVNVVANGNVQTQKLLVE